MKSTCSAPGWFYLRRVLLQAFGSALLETAQGLHSCLCGLKRASSGVKGEAVLGGLRRAGRSRQWAARSELDVQDSAGHRS